MPELSNLEEHFGEVAVALLSIPGVTLGGGRRGFGSDALQVNGRIFAMLSHGRLVLKLPAVRVTSLITSGDGAPYDAGKGRPLKEWVVITKGSSLRWLDLAEQAREFVGGPYQPTGPLVRGF